MFNGALSVSLEMADHTQAFRAGKIFGVVREVVDEPVAGETDEDGGRPS